MDLRHRKLLAYVRACIADLSPDQLYALLTEEQVREFERRPILTPPEGVYEERIILQPDPRFTPRSEVPPKLHLQVVPGDADRIRLEMEGLQRGTPEFERIRDSLGWELGYNRHQVSVAASSKKRYAKTRVTMVAHGHWKQKLVLVGK